MSYIFECVKCHKKVKFGFMNPSENDCKCSLCHGLKFICVGKECPVCYYINFQYDPEKVHFCGKCDCCINLSQEISMEEMRIRSNLTVDYELNPPPLWKYNFETKLSTKVYKKRNFNDRRQTQQKTSMNQVIQAGDLNLS